MSQKASPSVKVNCHHSGVFKKKGDNLEFVDGELVVLEVDSGCVFTSLMSKLIERRIVIGKMRFKLPYESLEDCKPLWEKVEFNKKKLGIAGRWYKEVDLYIEKDVTARETEASIPDKETEPSEHEKEREDNVPEEGHEEAEGGEVGSDDEIEDATYEGEASDDECIDSEAGLSEKSESDDDVEVVEEEIEVFKDVNYEEQIPDEDEQYPATDDSSGDEEEQAERLVKRNMPDGIFSLRQLFNTEDIRRDPEMSAPEIKDEMKRRYNIIISPPQSQVARRMVFDKLQAETNEQFARGLKPVNGPKFWEETGGGRILAPPYKRPPGRPKGKARIKGVHESPSKKKVGRQGREGYFSLCGGKGHNSRKCPHESQEDRAKRRRLNEEAQLEGEVQAQLQAQEEANDEAQEAAEMEADFMAQLGEDEAHEEAEVQDVSSTAPQPTQVLRRSSRLASLLF
ncbi:hypothetical protein IGI04_001502, partial [Brassica rapa subsp. trilocularis]